MSLTEISTRVAFVAGLALLALLVIGWRKTAKDSSPTPIDSFQREQKEQSDVEYLTGADVGRLAGSKVLRVFSLGAIAILLGIMVSLAISLALSSLVTNILDRL